MLADWNITNFSNDGGPWAVTRVREPRPSLRRELRRSRIWVVRPGDTLSGIAAETGVPVHIIAATNGVRDANLIHVGQRLEVKR
jgi:hypothetical protein